MGSRVVDIFHHALPDRDDLDPLLFVVIQALRRNRQHVVDQARCLSRGEDRARTRNSLLREIGAWRPRSDSVDLAGRQDLGRVIGLGVDQFDVLLGHVVVLKGLEDQQVVDEADLDADLLAFQLGHRLDTRLGNDLVVAVGVVGSQNDDAFGASRPGDQGIAVGHQHGIGLAGGEGVHCRHVVEPLELHVDPGFLEPVLVDGNLPGHPARPIAVANGKRLGRGRGCRGVGGAQGHDKRDGEAQHETEGSLCGAHFILRAGRSERTKCNGYATAKIAFYRLG